jgi:very-short-patch-repair endonuclease
MFDEHQLARIARAQHGIVSARQLDLTKDQLHDRVKAGRLERVHCGVYRVGGAPATWESRLMAACLAAGRQAMASHRAAALLWGFEGVDPVAEICVPRDRYLRLDGVTVHRMADGYTGSLRNGVPVTQPARTLVDLGAVATEQQVDEALTQALVRRLVSVDGVREALDAVARKGRAGVGPLRESLNYRDPKHPDGQLEPRMQRLLRRHGLPSAQFQFEVLPRTRVDFAYPGRRLAIEVDGYGPHAGRAAFQRDRTRQNRLVAAGWTVLRYTWVDVVKRPNYVAAQLRGMLARERAA